MASDGVRTGYDIAQLRAVRNICAVPLIASGGAGAPEHFAAVFAAARVDGALAASVFHDGTLAIGDLKELPAPSTCGDPHMNALAPALQTLDWAKGDGLLPAIVQHAASGRVLMLGYMNPESLRLTLSSGRVVFYSRTRNELWTKGESSGNYLDVVQVSTDCDNDTILVLANPLGPTCHKGTVSCFADAWETASGRLAFLALLEGTIARRIAESPEGSYTARLYAAGLGRIAQKVGEEGVETALAAVTREDPELIGECADLLYHLLVLLKARNLSLDRVVQELASRHGQRP